MQKRLFILLLAALLAITPACAENAASPVYLLVDRNADGVETPVGSAVLYQDQRTLLTTRWALLPLKGTLYAIGEGGTLAVTGSSWLSEQHGLVLLTLESPSPATSIAPAAESSSLYTLGHNAAGQPMQYEASYPSIIPYNTTATMLYSIPEKLLPGSVLVNEQGALSAITLAAYGEGVNRYMALSMADIASGGQDVSWVTGFTVTPGNGYFSVDCSSCNLSCDRDDCIIGLFYADPLNPFYSYYVLEDDLAADVPAVPGRSYMVWIQHAHQVLSHSATRAAEDAVSASIPAAEPFTLYDYKDAYIYLASAPMSEAEAHVNTYLPPLDPLTADALSNEDAAIFLQVSSSYAVSQNIDATLLVALTTPEGYVFHYMSGFLFDITLQEEDVWNVPVYELLDNYLSFNESGAFTPGEYTISYYLDGALANSFTWTLE